MLSWPCVFCIMPITWPGPSLLLLSWGSPQEVGGWRGCHGPSLWIPGYFLLLSVY